MERGNCLLPLLLLVLQLEWQHTTAVTGILDSRLISARGPLSSLADLTAAMIRKELRDCKVLILFGDERTLQMVLPSFYSSTKGVITLNFNSFDSSDFVDIKTTLLEEDANVCLNYVILYEERFLGNVLAADETFWVGDRKILVLAVQNSDRVTMEKLVGDAVFRKSPRLIYAFSNPESSFWNIFYLSLYSGEERQSLKRINTWSPSQGFSSDDPLLPSLNLLDFEGFDFKVAALPYSPFVIDRDPSVGGPGRYRGIEINLLDIVAKYGNFTYHYTAPEDGQWGKQLPDGSWTGMIGMVGREEAEFAISDIAPSLMRLTVTDFSDIFIFDASELITPRALPLPLWQGPIRPFSDMVWLLIVFCFILSAFFIFVISKVPVKQEAGNIWFQSLVNCLIYAVLPLLMRGSKVDYKDHAGRLFICIWLTCAMIISIFYTSSLTSFLILPGYTKPIQNLEQLVTSEIGWAKVDFGGLQNEMLEKATDPVLKALGRGVVWRNDLNGILDDVVAGKIATWENAITTNLKVAVQYSDSSGQPLVHFTGYALLLERISWPLQKDAPFQKRFNVLINRVVESGLMNKFFEDIIAEEQKRQKEINKEEKKGEEEEETQTQIILTIDHFQGPFFIGAVGCFLGILSLIIELVISKVWK